MVTVYGKPGCPPCAAVARRFEGAGVPFDYVDVTEDRAGLDFVLSLGYQSTPVVVYRDKHFSGFRPALVDEFCGDYFSDELTGVV